jgi:CspA family cold shock protein
MTGVVKRLNKNQGFGFIRGEDGKEYFFHRSALKNIDVNTIVEGQEVTFEETEGPKGLRAEDVYV